MDFFSKNDRDEKHPYIPELKGLYQANRITRREFLRNATLLGMSAAAASTFIAGCQQQEIAAPEPAAAEQMEQPSEAPSGGPARG